MSIGRIARWAGGVAAALVVVAFSALFLIFPRVSAAPDFKVEMTPARMDLAMTDEAFGPVITPPERVIEEIERAKARLERYFAKLTETFPIGS